MNPDLHSRPSPSGQLIAQLAAALAVTGLLVAFLVALRLMNHRQVPDREIRELTLAPDMAPPPPPPPPPPASDSAPSPPPPPASPLPRLELEMDSSAPALRATLDPRLDLAMETAVFDLEVDLPASTAPAAPRSTSRTAMPSRPSSSTISSSTSAPPRTEPVRSVYSAGELDGTPRLRSRPSVAYPSDLLRQGVREGRVVLEIEISTSGGVTVRRVVSSNHARFSQLARSLAARSRFTTPTKNGRPVRAIYRWPIVLRP